LSVAGCATQKPTAQHERGFVAVPCPPDKALVYIYRVRGWHPDGKGIQMCSNGVPLVALHGREYCPLVLDPGPIRLWRQENERYPAFRKRVMKDESLNLESGKVYYLAFRFWFNPFHSPPSGLFQVDPAAAQSEMASCVIKP
jgi:hypothetical protein